MGFDLEQGNLVFWLRCVVGHHFSVARTVEAYFMGRKVVY